MASFLPKARLDAIVPENNRPFCGTMPICFLSSSCDISLISIPSKVICPLVTSKNLGIKFIRLDLPEPVLPIIAVVCPGLAVNERFSRVFSSASG